MTPDYLLIDAMQLDVLIEQKPLIKGDSVACLSRPPPSWQRPIATRAWTSGTPCIPSMAWRATRGMPPRTIWKRCANTARPHCTGTLLRQCATPAAGPWVLSRLRCPRRRPSLSPVRLASSRIRYPFAVKVPKSNGDNWLLTPKSGFVDLRFLGLLRRRARLCLPFAVRRGDKISPAGTHGAVCKFPMAYSKSKNVEAAQKLLNQGKVPQAIAEYQQILKFEPKDQVTLMTIGELYIRQGETFQAIDYFERLAQIFVGDGFLTKAIAVYKRIAKLAPEEIRPLEKLADLYVQQGVMSEARPLFLQLAEIHLKANRQPEAISLLKKLLVAEPDNLRIQIRLADLYHAMGQNADAIEAYVSAAQRALARGDQAECEKLVERALKIDPKNLGAVIVKARIYSSQGKADQAAKLLEQVTGLDKGGEQSELLLDIYIKNSDWEQASALASRVFAADIKNFGPAQKVVDALLQADEGEQAFALLNRIRIPMVDAGQTEAVGRLLSELSARLPGRLEPLEWLVELYSRANDSFHLPDALAHFGDALVAAKKYDRAKEIFEQLVAREPESDGPKRKLNAVLRKMGQDVGEEASAPAAEEVEVEEQSLPVELKKPAAPKLASELDLEAHEVKAKPAGDAAGTDLDDETQKFIAQSLTDVDLFASYGLTQKAIGLLEAILRRAPHHTPTLEKLLDFVLGAGDDRRTAELAAQLEQLHTGRRRA